MTLREAAERTGRSITTLRRYIRSGRLHAEKRYGRFGPEYFVSQQDLADAGLETEPRPTGRSLVPPAAATVPVAANELQNHAWIREIVPLSLFQELQMKHEQLLVQYGMVRAGGLRAMEMRADLDEAEKNLDHAQQERERVRLRLVNENNRLKQELRKIRLELEGKRLEVAALEEKTRALEMLTRNAVTNETLDVQLRQLSAQRERVRGLGGRSRKDEPSEAPGSPASPDKTPDH